MRSRRNRWLSGIGAAVLIGGLVLASGGSGVTPAAAQANPLQQILTKLDQILAAIAAIGGGGGADNYTLRWDQALPAAQRFVVLAAFGNAAVLDKNTGLVWEQSPEATTSYPWPAAAIACIAKTVGGQKGWRLPAIPELASLIAPAVPGPTLPAGHPFTNVQLVSYWSATTSAFMPTEAWFVHFGGGAVSGGTKAGMNPVWCVRGGMIADAY